MTKIAIGTIVNLHPCTDEFMQGAKQAEIRQHTETGYRVRLIVDGRKLTRVKLRFVHAANVLGE